MINIAILASGTGTNARELLTKANSLPHINISLVITDTEGAGVIDIAKSFSKKAFLIPAKGLSKSEHEAFILKKLTHYKIDWIFLAGYMRILSSDFLNSFYDSKLKQNRVINIHPSLLPLFKGLNAYKQAFNSTEDKSGVTIHFVDSEIDTGKIIFQESFQKNKNFENFLSTGMSLEHKLYPKVLELLNTHALDNRYKGLL